MLRVNEQLRAIWNGRDKDWPVTRGLLMSGKGNARVVQERYFTLLCHTIFVTPTRESTDFIATFLTDLFSSAVVHVDDKTLEAFGREQATSGKLVCYILVRSCCCVLHAKITLAIASVRAHEEL